MNFKQNMCRVSLCVAVVLISTSLMVHCDTLIEGEMCPGSVFKCISEEEMNSERMRRRCWIRCACRGYVYAKCKKSPKCSSATPYQCTCMGIRCRWQ